MFKSVFGSISGAAGLAANLVATVYGDGEIARSGRAESLEDGWVFADAADAAGAEFTSEELEAAALQISGMMTPDGWLMAEEPAEFLRRQRREC